MKPLQKWMHLLGPALAVAAGPILHLDSAEFIFGDAVEPLTGNRDCFVARNRSSQRRGMPVSP